jgi:hypothetical protein
MITRCLCRFPDLIRLTLSPKLRFNSHPVDNDRGRLEKSESRHRPATSALVDLTCQRLTQTRE